jgi:putative effector of murein hydrolase LrgA (UPF0299 family)
MKNLLLKLPEFYFLVLIFLAGYTSAFSIAPFYIVLMIVLILQIIFKNKVSGLLIGGLIFFCNLFFLVALLSEFKEFTEFDIEAQKLLFVGFSVWIVNIIASGTMMYRYVKIKTRSSQMIKFN